MNNYDYDKVNKTFVEYLRNEKKLDRDRFFEKSALLEVLHETIESQNIKDYLVKNPSF